MQSYSTITLASELFQKHCYILPRYVNSIHVMQDIEQILDEYIRNNYQDLQEIYENNKNDQDSFIEDIENFLDGSDLSSSIQYILIGLYPKFITDENDRGIDVRCNELDLKIKDTIIEGLSKIIKLF